MNKQERMLKAQEHVEQMAKEFSKEIEECINNSKVYSTNEFDNITPSGHYNKKVFLIGIDTVSALKGLWDKGKGSIALLNFASYKNPGGKFMDGSMAQEEAICHESALYNILANERFQKEFYGPNHSRLNRGLYFSNMIYTPNVPFLADDKVIKADVITCAAPNRGVALRYKRATDDEVSMIMEYRIKAILSSAYENNIKYLILGAYGCGVFKNKPEVVAKIFKDLLSNEFKDVFKYVVFAIPDRYSANYKAFKRVFIGN